MQPIVPTIWQSILNPTEVLRLVWLPDGFSQFV